LQEEKRSSTIEFTRWQKNEKLIYSWRYLIKNLIFKLLPMRLIKLSTILVNILLITSVFATPDGDFYISPKGNDKNSGSINAPFATLDHARKAVQKLKKTKHGDITIYLRGGHYEVSKTVIFNLEDSGNKNQTITYTAYPGETPILSAGKEVLGFKRPTSAIPNLPQIAQSKVVVANISEDFSTMYDNQGILPRAKSSMFVVGKGGGRSHLAVPQEYYKKWANPSQLEFHIRPHHAWLLNILPVSSIEHDKRVLRSPSNATYPIKHLHFLPDVKNAWIENAIEELDEPGEWVLDLKNQKIYLWPRGDSPIHHSNLNEIIKIEGQVDRKGPKDIPVKNLKFSGLTFKHGERYQIEKDDWGVQHDWDFIDKDNSLVRFRGAENCQILNCHFLHSGSNAIRLDLHAMHNTISGNHIEHIGGAGIFLCGYGPGKKDVNRKNTIHNNHIHHVGEIYWHSAGILISQSGENVISNNLVHHTNYTGIIISGVVLDFFRKGGRESSKSVRWHEIGGKRRSLSEKQAEPFLHTHDNIIENNEIHNVMRKMGDGNAIYIRGAGPNNIIRRNYVHHLITPMIMQCAIRTDGGQKDTLITENIIYKCTSQGMMLKLNNRFENNIVVDVIAPPRG